MESAEAEATNGVSLRLTSGVNLYVHVARRGEPLGRPPIPPGGRAECTLLALVWPAAKGPGWEIVGFCCKGDWRLQQIAPGSDGKSYPMELLRPPALLKFYS